MYSFQPLVVSLLAVIPAPAWACAVCFGDPDSPQTHGLNQAILFLLAVTAGVLAALASFFVCLWRRARLSRRAGEGDLGGMGLSRAGSASRNNGLTDE